MIFKTIEDDASYSGKRIVSIFGQAVRKIKDLLNAKFIFDTDFLNQLNVDNAGLKELKDKIDAGEKLSQSLIEATLSSKASKEAYVFANKGDFSNLADFTNEQKKLYIQMLASNKTLDSAASLISGYNNAVKNADGSSKLFVDGVSASNSALGSYLASLNGASASFGGYIKHLIKTKAATIGLQAATVALNLTLTLGLSFLMSKVTEWINKQEEARQAAEEGAKTYQDSVSSIEEYATKIEELRTKLDSSTLSEMDAYEAKSELLDIQNQLAESYGVQAAGIDLLNGKLQSQIDLVRQLTVAEANQYLNENRKDIQKAEKEMTKERNWFLGEYSNIDGLVEKDVMDNLIDKYSDYLEIIEDRHGVEKTIYFKGDVSEAKEVLNNFMTDLREAEEEYGEDRTLQSFSKNASKRLTETNKILEDYQEIYEAAQDAILAADMDKFTYQGEEDTAAGWLNDYAKAIEEYNKAVALGDSSEIEKAKNTFTAIDAAVQALLQNSEMSEYALYFEEARAQLNELAIAQQNFNEQLENDKTLKEYREELKALGMTEAKFLQIAINTSSIEEGTEAVRELIKAAQGIGLISPEITQAELENFANTLINAGALISSQVSEEDKFSLSDLFTSEDSTFSDSINTNLEKLQQLKDAIKAIDTGEFDETALWELAQTFPDIMKNTDDIRGFILGAMDEIIGHNKRAVNGVIEEASGLRGIFDNAIASATGDDKKALIELRDLVLKLAKEIEDIPVLDIEFETSGFEAVQSALEESVSSVGLSVESIEGLKKRFKGMDMSGVFEETAHGIRLNQVALEKKYGAPTMS